MLNAIVILFLIVNVMWNVPLIVLIVGVSVNAPAIGYALRVPTTEIVVVVIMFVVNMHNRRC